MGKAVLKKSVAKATPRPAAGKSTGKSGSKSAPVARSAAKAPESKSAAKPSMVKPSMVKPSMAKASPAATARPLPTKAAAAKPATPDKSAATGKSGKAAPVVAKKSASVPAKGVNGHKSKSPIETKPDVKPVPRVEQASSSGDSKPKKNQAGLTSKQLEFFRDLLLAKRRELVGDMSSMEREALQSGDSGLSTLPIHMADMGTDNYEQEFTLGLVEKDRNLLREINHALAKIQAGTYGICEGNGKPISTVRLEAQPWARYSIEWARMQERGGMR